MPQPRNPRSAEGARALLFDRLADLDPATLVEQQPLRVLTVEGLRESVRTELARLLNTRSPTPAEELETREWTVLDWGLPDYSGWYTRSQPNQVRLARLVEMAIRAYEPRLLQPRVRVERHEGNDRTLRLWIEGSIRIGTVLEPVSFPVALAGAGRKG